MKIKQRKVILRETSMLRGLGGPRIPFGRDVPYPINGILIFERGYPCFAE